MRAFLVAVDFFAAFILVPLSTLDAALGDGSWWLPLLAIIYLAGFSGSARRLPGRVAAWWRST